MAPGSRRRCGWYCEPRLSRPTPARCSPIGSLAPGAGSRRLFARGLPVAGGRRGAAHECAELAATLRRWSRRSALLPPGPSPLREDVARRGKKKKTGLKSREGGRTLQPRRRAGRPGISVPTKQCLGGLQTLCRKGGW